MKQISKGDRFDGRSSSRTEKEKCPLFHMTVLESYTCRVQRSGDIEKTRTSADVYVKQQNMWMQGDATYDSETHVIMPLEKRNSGQE